ncbi:ThiamineS protein [Nostocoides japonicum T1-X7]|uniref:ThiamineS protein n=1 Tax=Nostocoides japonicum T1-X7 TaxID=1194083 RepID=A0A077LYY6_9MICO|nr:MoaD/ThiS family protein [Tetrasphaera japonica]CCH77200.1 ThiamineS protein [Tetrasphaera japonica T1-X7]
MASDPGENRSSATPVTVRFWAAARAAAGVTEAGVSAATVGEARAELVRRIPDLEPLLPLCSVLVDGVRADVDHPLTPGSVIEVLPPFAGG